MTTRRLYEVLGRTADARLKCERVDNVDWFERHTAMLEFLTHEFMPSGAGFDTGTKIVSEQCSANRLVFTTCFHHMNDVGSYVEWTEHSVIVSADLTGVQVRVTGRDRNDIKDYIAEAFHIALLQVLEPDFEHKTYRLAAKHG